MAVALCCFSCSTSWNPNKVLGPPSRRDTTSWDKYSFAGPVVVPAQGPVPDPWRMFYYGRESEMWNLGVPAFSPFLPTGRIGMATSEDGGHTFRRLRGPCNDGSLLGPSDDPSAFDCLHIAVGDVVYDRRRKQWLMYYFGGGMEEAHLPGLPGAARGARFRAGLAISGDGVNFRRRQAGAILDTGASGEWDKLGVAWPRVLPPAPGGGEWIMSYHAHDTEAAEKGGGLCKSAGIAVSWDGMVWKKKGKVLTKGEAGAWDEAGVGVRHIVRFGGKYLMFYEGVNKAFEYSIGLAVSEDGVEWRKDGECGEEAGGPLLRARRGEADAWDNWIVGTPYVVAMDDASLRMYYMGLHIDAEGKLGSRGIGVAASHGHDFRTWKRLRLHH